MRSPMCFYYPKGSFLSIDESHKLSPKVIVDTGKLPSGHYTDNKVMNNLSFRVKDMVAILINRLKKIAATREDVEFKYINPYDNFRVTVTCEGITEENL